MKNKITLFAKSYKKALQLSLQQSHEASAKSARDLRHKAFTSGIRALDLIGLHERVLMGEILPTFPVSQRADALKRAAKFFASAINPINEGQGSARKSAIQLEDLIAALNVRTIKLAASNQELGMEVRHRKLIEEQRRWLSRAILTTQEDERKKISRELHDVIAQTLTGINVRLDTLKREAALNTKGLARNITLTQQMVKKSAVTMREFARELRPAVLDDLGLIPALNSFLKNFSARSGIHVHTTLYAGLERLNTVSRTVLYRVAQEALTNVARHAKASHVKVSILKSNDTIEMKIADNGKSFLAQKVLQTSSGRKLGIIGMRERVEMIEGTFDVLSNQGTGTTITVKIPFESEAESTSRTTKKTASKKPS